MDHADSSGKGHMGLATIGRWVSTGGYRAVSQTIGKVRPVPAVCKLGKGKESGVGMEYVPLHRVTVANWVMVPPGVSPRVECKPLVCQVNLGMLAAHCVMETTTVECNPLGCQVKLGRLEPHCVGITTWMECNRLGNQVYVGIVVSQC